MKDSTATPSRAPETGAFFPRDRNWHPPAYTPGYKTSILRSPQRAPLSFDNTISEITGPAFGRSMLGELDNDLIHNFAKPGEAAIGPRIIVHGRVLDERARPVSGVLSNSGRPTQAVATATRTRAIWRHSIRISAAAVARSRTRTDTTGFAASGRDPIHGRTASTTGGRRISTSRSSATALLSG